MVMFVFTVNVRMRMVIGLAVVECAPNLLSRGL